MTTSEARPPAIVPALLDQKRRDGTEKMGAERELRARINGATGEPQKHNAHGSNTAGRPARERGVRGFGAAIPALAVARAGSLTHLWS